VQLDTIVGQREVDELVEVTAVFVRLGADRADDHQLRSAGHATERAHRAIEPLVWLDEPDAQQHRHVLWDAQTPPRVRAVLHDRRPEVAAVVAQLGVPGNDTQALAHLVDLVRRMELDVARTAPRKTIEELLRTPRRPVRRRVLDLMAHDHEVGDRPERDHHPEVRHHSRETFPAPMEERWLVLEDHAVVPPRVPAQASETAGRRPEVLDVVRRTRDGREYLDLVALVPQRGNLLGGVPSNTVAQRRKRRHHEDLHDSTCASATAHSEMHRTRWSILSSHR
jgi:hypothetical protein